MESFTLKEILVVVIGSGGFVGGLISIIGLIIGRLDKRKKDKEDNHDKAIHQSSEMKRLELDSRSSIEQSLWKMIEAKDREIESLESEIKELEKISALTRPVISKIMQLIRAMRMELDSINVIMMSQEETNVFYRRWMAVKKGLDELEELLP